MNMDTVVPNLERAPSAIIGVKDKALTWYYDDVGWTGAWSAKLEGYINPEDLRVSNTDLRIDIISNQGKSGGIIATKKICGAFPFFDYLGGFKSEVQPRYDASVASSRRLRGVF